MGKYRDTHKELHALIVAQLKADALDKNEPDSASLDELLEIKADSLLLEYEQLAAKRTQFSFWYGVWQSLVGGLLVFPILALLAFTLSGFKLNIFRILSEDTTPPTAAVAPTPRPATPTTTVH